MPDLARLIGDPTRLRILAELLGGVELPAGAMAARVGVAPSTVSAHLARLEGSGLIHIRSTGRTRLARLTRNDVAEAVESVLGLASEAPVHSLAASRRRTAMRAARACYDHVAGRAGVGLADLALSRGWILDDDGTWLLGDGQPEGLSEALGLPILLRTGRRPAVRSCVDWTERRPHLAGRLGAALLDAFLAAGWLRRRPDDRALSVTAGGIQGLKRVGLDVG